MSTTSTGPWLRLAPSVVARLWFLLSVLIADPVVARRAPAPGGTAIVAVPPEETATLVEAHLYAPLLVPLPREAAATHPQPLPGAPGFASNVLTRVDVDPAGLRWTLSTVAPRPGVAASVQRCLAGRGAAGFAAWVLIAGGVSARVEVASDNVVVVFNRPLFVLPLLLANCPLVGNQEAATGAYVQTVPLHLSWRAGEFDPPPLLSAVDVRQVTSPNDKADIVARFSTGGEDGGATLLSPWSDVVVLVQSESAATRDAFGLKEPRAGLRSFRSGLRADVLAAAWASGRGGPTDALLPPGVAPARPLPSIGGSVDRAPLTLTSLPPDAPRVKIALGRSEPLMVGVAERLAVLLRARGALLELQRGTPEESESELVRWHPPTRDAALALLSFLGERPALLRSPTVQRVLDIQALLSSDAAMRLGAALALERALLDSRLVVPLLAVDRWWSVDPDLRGVVLREDGVPMLDGAWWGGAR
jgi:hypothetical protein